MSDITEVAVDFLILNPSDTVLFGAKLEFIFLLPVAIFSISYMDYMDPDVLCPQKGR